MKNTRIGVISLVAAGLGFALHAHAAAESHAALVAEAKVTEAQATATALATVPGGAVKSTELEREHGRLVWSFDISRPTATGVTEILVDAKTGKVASIRKESPTEEAKEARADAKK